ncbi:hypothetical protein PQR62_15815 [Herbaspirillum lusitanum]|jgi:hypothetical protein|uniref:Uncharacterized protein n=1 Tax=Herbaspirillum lusitanum TaxID=213312 RepID=A0ABW9AA96_9BURK
MLKFIARAYGKLLDYLNDSGSCTTGSHQGEPTHYGLYSSLNQNDAEHGRK